MFPTPRNEPSVGCTSGPRRRWPAEPPVDGLAHRPAFILGNGPTLPVDDLDCLTGQFTVGVNRILLSGFTPTVLLWADGSVARDDPAYGEMMDASGALLVCDRSVARRPFHVGLKTHVGDAALTHQSTPTELCVNASTGCCAARWALALGCRPVYLVGMGAAYDGERTDFYGVNPRHKPGLTLHGMRRELTRLEVDFPGVTQAIPDGVTLREVAAAWPCIDQGELRQALRAALASPQSGR